jgi:LysM repeat protein
MPAFVVYLLLFAALIAPIPGAILLRLLNDRISERGMLIGTAVLVGAASISVLTLSQVDVGPIRIGNISLMLERQRPSDPVDVPEVLIQPAEVATPVQIPTPVIPTLTPRPSETPVPSTTPPPSITPSPTLEPTATATAVPPTATPLPAGETRTYTVESGDTLRSIAAQFDVTVDALLEANGLTSAEGDAIRPGQELIIP